ncbi:DUF4062 domain-containing protein [Geobacter sp. 60473]|uniref:DUF4062 domain-containing protein n=1 Tax=Geobacter sp. 60473 TaxID=3080755 RepID=UPI002B2BDED3|nr:hypothetical protein GEO60473_22000 [Geobacter sp. 60473]
MPTPKVFLSSTYLDLEEIRHNVHRWIIDNIGYYSVAFEKGGVFFNPEKTIDNSCYDEVKNCHFLVSIIAGRYGSKATDEPEIKKNGILHYNSITKKEFLTARKENLYTYIFVKNEVL